LVAERLVYLEALAMLSYADSLHALRVVISMPSFVIDINYFEDRHNIEGEYVLAIRSKREIGANHCEERVRSCTQFGNNNYSSVVASSLTNKFHKSFLRNSQINFCKCMCERDRSS
jgi:hypothetical protein